MAAEEFEIEYTVTVNGKRDSRFTLDNDLGGEATFKEFAQYFKEHLIIFSDRALTDEQAKGFDKEPVRLVDNNRNKFLGDINPFGKVEYVSRIQDIAEVLNQTFETIAKKSPVVTGDYLKEHVVLYNGDPIASDPPELAAWLKTPAAKQVAENDYFEFINAAPYARKLETLGVTRDRQQRRRVKSKSKNKAIISKPNGTYYLTFRSIRRKYGKNVGVFFNLIPGNQINLDYTFKSSKNVGKAGARTYLYPSIKIIFKQSGVL